MHMLYQLSYSSIAPVAGPPRFVAETGDLVLTMHMLYQLSYCSE